eukprot:COSAG01_NODE_5431_length_4266_cov_18.916838_2_plen_288_part_00
MIVNLGDTARAPAPTTAWIRAPASTMPSSLICWCQAAEWPLHQCSNSLKLTSPDQSASISCIASRTCNTRRRSGYDPADTAPRTGAVLGKARRHRHDADDALPAARTDVLAYLQPVHLQAHLAEEPPQLLLVQRLAAVVVDGQERAARVRRSAPAPGALPQPSRKHSLARQPQPGQGSARTIAAASGGRERDPDHRVDIRIVLQKNRRSVAWGKGGGSHHRLMRRASQASPAPTIHSQRQASSRLCSPSEASQSAALRISVPSSPQKSPCDEYGSPSCAACGQRVTR